MRVPALMEARPLSISWTHGTISPTSGAPFNFLATDANINLLLSDFTTGGDSLSPPTGLDPRVLAGTAGLLTSPTVPHTALFTQSGGGLTESITMEFAARAPRPPSGQWF
jgi:hypothetical protein